MEIFYFAAWHKKNLGTKNLSPEIFDFAGGSMKCRAWTLMILQPGTQKILARKSLILQPGKKNWGLGIVNFAASSMKSGAWELLILSAVQYNAGAENCWFCGLAHKESGPRNCWFCGWFNKMLGLKIVEFAAGHTKNLGPEIVDFAVGLIKFRAQKLLILWLVQ